VRFLRYVHGVHGQTESVIDKRAVTLITSHFTPTGVKPAAAAAHGHIAAHFNSKNETVAVFVTV